MEGIKFWMNFVVENSIKLQKNGFQRECVHTWGQRHMLPYLSVKENNLFCCHYDISQTMVSWVMLWNLSSKSSQWIGVHQLGLECLELQCGINLLLNHFFIEFFEKPRLKIILEFGGILGIVGKPSPRSWFCHFET